MASEPPSSKIKSVETLLDIVQCLHGRGEATMEEIADELGLSVSTVHRHLVTLREHNYVTIRDGRYRLSLMFLTHGGKTRDQMAISEMIDSKVQQISERTGERTQFMIEENGERVYVYTYAGPSGVKTDATIGKRGPLHVSAAGKSILANLPQERINAILDEISFESVARNTIADRETLKAELAAVRRLGYAYNDEESTEGLRAVGVPIQHDDGSVFGAISVSAPNFRLQDDYFHKELPELLLGAANEIELILRYS